MAKGSNVPSLPAYGHRWNIAALRTAASGRVPGRAGPRCAGGSKRVSGPHLRQACATRNAYESVKMPQTNLAAKRLVRLPAIIGGRKMVGRRTKRRVRINFTTAGLPLIGGQSRIASPPFAGRLDRCGTRASRQRRGSGERTVIALRQDGRLALAGGQTAMVSGSRADHGGCGSSSREDDHPCGRGVCR
jgi:hypothetical protein